MTEEAGREGVDPSESEGAHAVDDHERTTTGVPAADAAAERLSEVERSPLEDHVEIYEDVHRRLQEGLADLDEQ